MKGGKKTWAEAGKTRFLIFLFTALLHALLLAFVAFQAGAPERTEEASANIMKLVDVGEETPAPPPPPPPPPPREIPPENFQNTVDAVAETMIETDEVPDEVTSNPVPYATETGRVGTGGEEFDFLPMSRISVLPVFPEDQIRRAIVYPPIALRSGIEGIVYLELFVDRQGEIRQIGILRETPPGRGFGEAAINAFKGIRGIPAEANGQQVAVRYRYPVRFTIR
jgi:protein TonB